MSKCFHLNDLTLICYMSVEVTVLLNPYLDLMKDQGTNKICLLLGQRSKL